MAQTIQMLTNHVLTERPNSYRHYKNREGEKYINMFSSKNNQMPKVSRTH